MYHYIIHPGLRFLILWAVLITCSSTLSAQNYQLHGQVVDENGEGLPFATIHEKNTTKGTTSNALGFYTLESKQAQLTVVFQYVGYKTQEIRVDLVLDQQLNIQLEPDVLVLEELVVEAGAEDPAYAIIKKAIDNRRGYLTELKDYQCEVYIKGLQRLNEVPERVLGIPVTVDSGIVYLSESVSALSVQAPNKVKERVISSKVSGDNRAFSFNQASDMLISFYENQIYSEGLSERSFVSPIADNAFLFYDYQFLGTIQEDEHLINKIKVIPKRGHDPSFSGLIYIVEDSWRIHSVDLLLTKEHQIEFVDSLRIKQVMAPVPSDDGPIWTVLSQQFEFLLNAFGFKGQGYFVGVYTDYQINEGFPERYFNNEIVRVETNSNKKDSSYWQETRPVPLTIEEIDDYRIKDSVQIVKKSKHYLDSIDQKNNKITPTHILTGKTFRNSHLKRSFYFPALIETVQFNTVEGLVLNLRTRYTQRFEDFRFYQITPEVRYGFSSEKFYGQIRTRYYYDPLKFASVRLEGGHFIEDLHAGTSLKAFDNTYYSLVLEKNYRKIYERSYVRARHNSEVINGLYVDASLLWEQRAPLFNTTDYTFKDRDERVYTPNHPLNVELPQTEFPKHQALVLGIKVEWQPGQKYVRRPYRKFVVERKYPAVTLNYQAALSGVLGSDVAFQKLSLGVNHEFKLGLWGTGSYLLKVGGLISDDSLSFIDYQHFNGNRTVFGHFELGNFQLLDYYLYSTAENFAQAHYEHHFNGFIINKAPLLRKTRVQAVAAINFLRTDLGDSYWEVGVGLEHIFKIIRVDFYNSWLAGSHQRNGFRLGIGF